MSRARLTKNFTLDEFTTSQTAARNGLDNTPGETEKANLLKVAQWLQSLRDLIERVDGPCSIRVSSGFRSKKVNRLIGSRDTSAHVHGLAADFTASGYTARELFEFIRTHMRETPFDQIILEYDTWIHLGLEYPKGGCRGEFLEAKRIINPHTKKSVTTYALIERIPFKEK